MSPLFGTVCHTEALSLAVQRIVFDGPGLDGWVPSESTDQYVNALFVPDDAPYEVPFDVEKVRKLDAEVRPRGRRYTVRRWDPERRQLTIDFVVHGDIGFAGRWASRAVVGDRLQIEGPSGAYRPDPRADWHLMVGDESALPAIAASLEALRPGARCVVVAVVDSSDHVIELPTASTIEVDWRFRSTAADPEAALLDGVAELDWQPGHVDVFVHGEAAEVRAVRKFLLAERHVDRDEASISPYWRRDCTDEAWRQIKQQWLQEQDADV